MTPIEKHTLLYLQDNRYLILEKEKKKEGKEESNGAAEENNNYDAPPIHPLICQRRLV